METGRGADCLDRMLSKDFKGTVQADGYSAYRAFAAQRSEVKLAGCLAHARRKFHEALEQSGGRAGWVLRQIQHLYRIESELREKKSGPNLRQAIRAHQSRPIMQRIKTALLAWKARGRQLPQSLLGQAIDYALRQWSALETFLGDGKIEIDNNLVENAICPTAIGKKNWLHRVLTASLVTRGLRTDSSEEPCKSGLSQLRQCVNGINE